MEAPRSHTSALRTLDLEEVVRDLHDSGIYVMVQTNSIGMMLTITDQLYRIRAEYLIGQLERQIGRARALQRYGCTARRWRCFLTANMPDFRELVTLDRAPRRYRKAAACRRDRPDLTRSCQASMPRPGPTRRRAAGARPPFAPAFGRSHETAHLYRRLRPR
jgi:hypothetical protein